MPRFRYAKLVRDKIVDKQIASGAKLHYRTLTSKEHKQALIQKLTEEAAEISEASSGELTSEIADVLQVIDDLIEICGLSKETVLKVQAAKNKIKALSKKATTSSTLMSPKTMSGWLIIEKTRLAFLSSKIKASPKLAISQLRQAV